MQKLPEAIQLLLAGKEVKEPLTSEEVEICLAVFGTLWLYRGEPSKDRPHVKLTTSERHSNGYANVGGLLKSNPAVRRAMALSLCERLSASYSIIEFVVGADTSSTLLAEDVAKILGARHLRMVKVEDTQGKRQVWHPDNPPIHEDEKVLQVEDLITTATSSLQVREGIRLGNPGVKISFAHYLPVIVDRSDHNKRITRVEHSHLRPLIQLDIRSYDPTPEDCPYCAVGSEAIDNPKLPENWKKLTG